jgi:hypothetical protein
VNPEAVTTEKTARFPGAVATTVKAKEDRDGLVPRCSAEGWCWRFLAIE